METAEQPIISNSCLFFHIESLYRRAIVLSRNAASASDLVQQTYVRALGSRNHSRDDSNIRRSLFTILRNIWLEQLHPTQHHLPEDGPHLLWPTMEGDRVLEAIQQLPGQFREIVALREFADLSYREIAQVLRCSTRAVKSRLDKARARLRILLTDQQVERWP
jgi:RNA polymerase sigma-70 factor (ECF subfamily)